MASNSNCREVCVEVYVNGELYCIDSVEVPDEENVQMEFMVTDRIYELLGCSPGDITAQLEVETDECMSVSHAALEGEDVQIDIDVKHPTCTCTAPANSPTESTTEWVKRKISGFFQMIFWMDPAVPDPTPEKDRVPEPEVNLVTVRWPAEVPGDEKNSPKRESTEEKSDFFEKCFPLDPCEPSCDPEPEPVSAEDQETDISDGMDASPKTADMNGLRESTEEKKMSAFFEKCFPLDRSEPSCVPDASDPEPEPESAGDQETDISDGMDDQGGIDGSPEKGKIKMKMSALFKKYFPLDPCEPSCDPEAEPESAEDQETDISDGMDASPETADMNGLRGSAKKKKMSAFFKKYFPLDPFEPSCDPEAEPVSAEDQETDISDGMDASPETADMNGPRESTKKKKMSAFFKKYFPLDPSEPLCVPDASDPEPEPVSAEDQETDISEGMDASPETAEMNGPRESTKKMKMSAFFKKYFPLDQAEPSCVPESE